MKISNNWLKTLINSDITPEETAEKLTASGLEVEGVEIKESIRGGLKGLVVGQVTECSRHPDADRLSLTKVDIGQAEPLSIVCGAPNVAAGQKVIVATIGSRLFPTEGEPFDIKKSKIRGALSEGMLCAEDEIGLGKSHEGIMVLPEDIPAGTPAADYFKVEQDHVFEVGLTPNRSDAASHLGVARDLAAILNSQNHTDHYSLSTPGIYDIGDASGINTVEIVVENLEACKRYAGLVITGISVGESPAWLKNRLLAIDVRPVNNIVDITNFVLHELGQPLHAFDLDKIKDRKIVVRNARDKEKLRTLDGQERELSASDLVIAHASEPLCIAGIFGGMESGVTAETRSVFLESAYFDPASIRRTSKHHSLKTDASFRFERGTDPEMVITALIRAANLIFDISGGSLSMGITDIYPEPLPPYKVAFSYANCRDLIGKEIDRNTIKSILVNLGIGILQEGTDGLLLSVPRYKTDVTREADVIEEVMRIYGYDHVEPSRAISYTAAHEPANTSILLENKAGSLLESWGFQEIMSLSLSKETYYADTTNLVRVVNPLSADLNILRGDMIFSGLEAISHNINRKNADLKFFEFGKTYQVSGEQDKNYRERKYLSLFVTGRLFKENPYGLNQKADFAFLRSAIDQLLEKAGTGNCKCSESQYPGFEYGLSYQLNKQVLAEAGLVSRPLLKKFDISQAVFYAVLDWELLVKAQERQQIRFREISKYPSVRRDLALLIDRSVSYQQIEELAYATERKFLREVNLFDIYEDKKLGNKKSYAVSFTLSNHEATLTDKQIDTVMDKLITGYKEKLGAELR